MTADEVEQLVQDRIDEMNWKPEVVIVDSMPRLFGVDDSYKLAIRAVDDMTIKLSSIEKGKHVTIAPSYRTIEQHNAIMKLNKGRGSKHSWKYKN